uniref:Ig-like domain-containing protein n=1 Tax=Oryzias sinensis TaxID=183150 RepID=A0A8C7YHF9_9TELE
MGASLRALYGATLILLVRLSQLCEARVNTEIQVGPLYRVVDTRLSIFCNASGYPSDKRTEFQFLMSRPSRPDFSFNIISSEEPDFSYASHGRRVANRDIVLMHQGQSDVLFVIEKLLKEDEGEYECISVSKETVLDGTFSAKTIVKVIDDSLIVSLPASSTSMSLKEGEALSLTCQASSDTLQHTHLSVVWFLKKEGQQDPQPIISLSRDFTLIPGGDFKQRYKEGAINLDKIGETTYRLEMTELQLSDQGQIYCQAQEWIQDPDRSWYSINQKDTEKIDLTVKARVKISSEKTLLLEGQELLVSCSVDTQNLKERFFSVAWFLEDIELIRIGPTGILTVSLDDQRVEEGGLRAIRIGDGDYRFGLKPVSKDDQGSYNCVAWPEERELQQPADHHLKSGLSVKMQNPTLNVNQLDKLMLVCKVGGAKDYLSVNWEFKSASSSTFTSIISLESDGVMKKDATFKDRQVRATRPASDSFVFELDQVTLADSGQYKCHVVEKVPNQDLHTNASECAVTVIPLASLMEVSLRSRSISPTIGAEAVLMCKVKGPRIPITVSWIKKKNLDIDEIVKLNYNGDISWSGNQESYQVSVRNQKDSVIYDLKLTSASQMEKGTYQCSVSTFLEGAHKKLATSNGLDVAVQNPGMTHASTICYTQNICLARLPEAFSKKKTFLTVFFLAETHLLIETRQLKELNISRDKDFTIPCHLTKQTSNESQFQVTWFWQEDTESDMRKAIFTVYRNSTLQSSFEEVDLRFSHPGESIFSLTVLKPSPQHSGLYFCEVEEWLPSLPQEWRRVTTNLYSYFTKTKFLSAFPVGEKEHTVMDPKVPFSVTVVILLLIIVALVITICKTKGSGSKKQNHTLWAEQGQHIKLDTD